MLGTIVAIGVFIAVMLPARKVKSDLSGAIAHREKGSLRLVRPYGEIRPPFYFDHKGTYTTHVSVTTTSAAGYQ
jgi:hypothetical protein